MRIAVLADAHGNAHGFFAAREDARRRGVDRVVCAGDMVCCLPDGKAILEAIVSEGFPCVRGNGESRLLDWFEADSASPLAVSPQFLPLQVAGPEFDGKDRDEMAAWPLAIRLGEGSADDSSFLLCHGTPESNTATIHYHDREPAATHIRAVTARMILAGHHHCQWRIRSGPTDLVLVGSCGVPHLEDADASTPGGLALFAIVDTETAEVSFHSLRYDFEALARDYRRREVAQKGGPIIWLHLAQLANPRPYVLWYFRDDFDPNRGADMDYLEESVGLFLERHGVFDIVDEHFGPLEVTAGEAG